MIYAVIFIVILFLIAAFAYICYLVWHYPGVAPPLQPEHTVEHTVETGIDDDRLRTWPTLTMLKPRVKIRERLLPVVALSVLLTMRSRRIMH
ncbi:hypothetical protein IEQ34_009891 [Dendrobium chrysotoxum]|uniref:ATP synthase F0 subunit 8 n=1 Tax=Dendrobium chrysotoxum TaxID=161865 RepID=A0AAV7GZS2_DENCH|nr:hypothetical protein IEQ34_009891 [Dendrobium chrysotoxum]